MPHDAPSATNSAKRWFELCGQLLVLYSIVVFYLESEMTAPNTPRASEGFWLWNERILLTLFCGEYAIRWWRSGHPRRYPFTLLAVIDLVAIVPALVGLTAGFRSLRLVRVLPLLWMFKLYRYNDALHRLLDSLRRVSRELSVVGFMALVVLLTSAGAIHELEREAQPAQFGRFADSLWWSFVTLTTVGYGDSYPVTGAGRVVAAVTMVLGIGVLGTFLSLLGSSFVTTFHRDHRDHHEPAPLPAPHLPGTEPEVLPSYRKAG
jgi:voltage-gated potassium channel